MEQREQRQMMPSSLPPVARQQQHPSPITPSGSLASLINSSYPSPLTSSDPSAAQMLRRLLILRQQNRQQRQEEVVQRHQIALRDRLHTLLENQKQILNSAAQQQKACCVSPIEATFLFREQSGASNTEPDQQLEPPTKKARKLSEDAAITAAPVAEKARKAKNDPQPAPASAEAGSGKLAKKDAKWLTMLQKLKDYKSEHGDCIVPRGYVDSKLASWVAEQRKQYKLLNDGKASSITPERISCLRELDFAWNAQEAAWAKHMSDLRAFRSRNGHCQVPLNHPEFPKLGLWVKEQRRHYTLLAQGKPSHMTTERAQELDRLGFTWDTHEATWLERFKELSQFRDETGHCYVPTNYKSNPKLGTWVHHQRRQRKKFEEGKACHITEERIKALESIGFVWYPREQQQHSGSGVNSSASSVTSVASLMSDDLLDVSSVDSRKRQRSAV
jgi:hypothetical protein